MTNQITFSQAGELGVRFLAAQGTLPSKAAMWTVLRTRLLAGREIDFTTMAVLVKLAGGKKQASAFIAAIKSTLPKKGA